MECPAVTMTIRRLERRLKSDKGLVKKIQRVLRMLQVKLRRGPIQNLHYRVLDLFCGFFSALSQPNRGSRWNATARVR
jgi:hypothetical protein